MALTLDEKLIEGLEKVGAKLPVHSNLVGTHYHDGISEQAKHTRKLCDQLIAALDAIVAKGMGEKWK